MSVICFWLIQITLILVIRSSMKSTFSYSSDSKVVAIFCRLVVMAFFYGLHLVAGYFRFQNIGLNPMRTFEFLVPGWGLFLLVFCTAAQPGYVKTRKLDQIGRTIVLVTGAAGIAMTALLVLLVLPQ